MAHDDTDRSLTEDGLKNSVKGKATEVKGKVKDAVGGLTGNPEMQAEGKIDQLAGKVQNAVGKAERTAAKNDKEMDRDANRGA
jgi:uncharacterized protein YjbJ (UPF0337 family)